MWIGFRIGFQIKSDRIGIFAFGAELLFWEKAVLTMTQVNEIFSFQAASVSNNKICFSCIISIKIHYQLKNHYKKLFSAGLYWEIFFCITSCDHKTRLGYVTSPKWKMAERGANVSHWFCFFSSLLSTLLVFFLTEPKWKASFQRRWLRKSWQWARYDSDDLSIS